MTIPNKLHEYNFQDEIINHFSNSSTGFTDKLTEIKIESMLKYVWAKLLIRSLKYSH